MQAMAEFVPHIPRLARALKEQLVALRRDFCLYPELSGEEARSARMISRHLRRLGLEIHTGIGGHGVVGILQGAQPGKTVAYRADMDAMPVQDLIDKPYRSSVLGVKHACGHDAHMTIALGTAEVLAKVREHLSGSVAFIFQPAEESLAGARAMLEAGVLDLAGSPEAMFALHAFPIPTGQVGISEGLSLAGMDEFRARFYSPAGHLKTLIDQAGEALRALSNATTPKDLRTFNAVVDAMQTSDAHRRTVFVSTWPLPPNPQHHQLMALLSVPDPALRRKAHEQVQQTLHDVADAYGATYNLNHTFYNPPVVNDAALVHQIQPWIHDVVGPEHVLPFRAPYPFAHEDFALYQEHVPGVFMWLGTANPAQGVDSILHQSTFDIDEDALVVGVQVAATLLARCLVVGL